ncbi:MAG TPA: hypothetical protein PLZ10_10700, partial [Chitinophagaceae bacterium]|nr:hypothetical protein [Chitinophagaceae bacterium]
MIQESKAPVGTIQVKNKPVKRYDDLGSNIDLTTVESFGEEWNAFHHFDDAELKKIGDTYFDIIT